MKLNVSVHPGLTLVLNYKFVCNRCGSTIWTSDTVDSRWTPCVCMTDVEDVQPGNPTLERIARAVEEERKACAKIAAAEGEKWRGAMALTAEQAAADIATAIFARGKIIVEDGSEKEKKT